MRCRPAAAARSAIIARTLLAGGLLLMTLRPGAGRAFGQTPLPPPPPAGAAPPLTSEEFHYHWRVLNLIGVVAGLFLPNHGDGELSFKLDRDGHMTSELVITSPESREGEFWRYGSEIDLRTLQPIRAWSSYLWRGRSKSKSDEIEQKGVLDVVSSIYALRHDPPAKPRRMGIWSDGKIYPIVIIPLGDESRMIEQRRVEARHYSIRGIEVDKSPHWNGRVEVWLAHDTMATPVEIDISRSLASVRLEIHPSPAAPPG